MTKGSLPGIKAKPPAQRLPVPAGWRFCRRRVERRGWKGLAGKKLITGVVEAPPHGQALARLSWRQRLCLLTPHIWRCEVARNLGFRRLRLE